MNSEIVSKSKVDPKRDIATASKYVRIFKRRRGE